MKSKGIIAAFIISLAVLAQSQESVTLRYKPEIGKEYRYKSETKVTGVGDTTTTPSGSDTVEVYKCLELTEKLLTMLVQIESHRSITTTNLGFGNSESSAKSDLPEIFKDSKILFECSPLGEFKKLKEKLPNGLDKIVGSLNSFQGKPSMGLIYPKQSLTIGKGWEREATSFEVFKEMTKSFPVKLNIEKPVVVSYVLKSFGDHNGRKTAVIELKGAGTATMKPNKGAGKGIVYAKVDGLIEVDLETGMQYSHQANTVYHLDFSEDGERMQGQLITKTTQTLVE